jgi:hypothetical protein
MHTSKTWRRSKVQSDALLCQLYKSYLVKQVTAVIVALLAYGRSVPGADLMNIVCEHSWWHVDRNGGVSILQLRMDAALCYCRSTTKGLQNQRYRGLPSKLVV